MAANLFEECLADVSEIIFEPSFDRQQAPHAAGLVFRRMGPSVKRRIGLLREIAFRDQVMLYFRPLGEAGLGLSFIVRDAVAIGNSAPLSYDARAFAQFESGLRRGERLIMACYQRDRHGVLRYITDTRFEPYFFPVYHFRSAAAMAEEC